MIKIKTFTFNPFQENTYLVYNQQGACLLIDPGCYFQQEQQQLTHYISHHHLKPQFIVQSHGHVDHAMGVNFVKQHYQIQALMHADDLPILRQSKEFGKTLGLDIEQPSDPEKMLSESQPLELGQEHFTLLHVPGHSPGSIALYHAPGGILVSGDVLFHLGIGRTDLPGGDAHRLFQSIREKLFTLPDETRVYPGHGPPTTIGKEKGQNPLFG